MLHSENRIARTGPESITDFGLFPADSEQEHRADLVLLDPLTGDVEFPTDDHDRKKVLLVLAASLSIPSNLS